MTITEIQNNYGSNIFVQINIGPLDTVKAHTHSVDRLVMGYDILWLKMAVF